jgi:cytochrome c
MKPDSRRRLRSPIDPTGLSLLLLVLLLVFAGCLERPEKRILAFSKTDGYRHESIPDAHQALRDVAASIGATIDSTEDASMFADDVLAEYDLVIFASTSEDVLNPEQQLAFQRYIRDGGAFVGIHSASDTEYDWPWYAGLVGGYFDGHPSDPGVRSGLLVVEDAYHPSTNHLRFQWTRDDEWYDIRERNPNVNVLISVVDSTYKESWDEDRHPLSWYHVYDGGRAFYTALGHTSESYQEAAFVRHLRGGIEWALGLKNRLPEPPPESSFRREILADSLNEPMELEVLPDGRIAFIQRPGQFMLFDRRTNELSEAGRFGVSLEGEDGLLGFAVDPEFPDSPWMYFYYAPADSSVNRLSRLTFENDLLIPASETVLLEVPVVRGCCHSGASIEFDANGNLYLSTGDDTDPFESDGFSPLDERPGKEVFNAQRSAANTNDLRGKILRITPQSDGTYAIPEDNLADRYGIEARPEIYTMGHRNPFRISIDARNGFLYWGDVGPDAESDTERGPRGYDEIGQARESGNYGWPYTIADNEPYRSIDFESGQLGEWFDVSAPENASRLNTGAVNLPAAQPAMIWYPYGDSPDFPMLGQGGRTSMAGPVFYREDFDDVDGRFPSFFDGKLFIYDWMRHWIKVVTMGHKGDLLRIEDFMPSIRLNRPTDMVFGPDGALYLLEYGTKWKEQNAEARLSRIEYNE